MATILRNGANLEIEKKHHYNKTMTEAELQKIIFQTHLINCFVFIDCENVSAKEAFDFLKTHSFFNLQTQIVCLIGSKPNQNSWYNDFKDCIANVSSNIAPIRLSKTGKQKDQSLDKVLIAYVGFAIGQNQLAEIHILAKDKGYEDVAEHFKSAGVNITHENIVSQKQSENIPAKTASNASKETVAKNKTSKTEQKASDENKKTTTKKKTKNTWTIDEAANDILSAKKKLTTKTGLSNQIKQKYDLSDLDASEVIKKLDAQKKIEITNNKITWKK